MSETEGAAEIDVKGIRMHGERMSKEGAGDEVIVAMIHHQLSLPWPLCPGGELYNN